MKSFIPSLNPHNTKLMPQYIGNCVYALCTDVTPLNNSSFIIGNESVIVIDSLISKSRADEIQSIILEHTDKPIKYLINTNYHGDHTFANCFFPVNCQVIAHTNTLKHMHDYKKEKSLILKAVGNDENLFKDITWRLPDITFNEYLQLDLGERIIELHYFGKGNSEGDIIVYDPLTKTACSGNLVLGDGLLPNVFDGDITSYINTLHNISTTLEIETIIPGHGKICGADELNRQLDYLRFLQDITCSELNINKILNHSLDEFLNHDNSSENINNELITQIHCGNIHNVMDIKY